MAYDEGPSRKIRQPRALGLPLTTQYGEPAADEEMLDSGQHRAQAYPASKMEPPTFNQATRSHRAFWSLDLIPNIITTPMNGLLPNKGLATSAQPYFDLDSWKEHLLDHKNCLKVASIRSELIFSPPWLFLRQCHGVKFPGAHSAVICHGRRFGSRIHRGNFKVIGDRNHKHLLAAGYCP